MSLYGQYCPVSKAVEVLGERWTLLVVRELLLGSTRFNELQRGLSKMSPSLLTKRLKELEEANLLYRIKISGQKGYEYHLTPAGKDLMPLVMELARWGMVWVKDSLSQQDGDVEFLLWDIHRNIKKQYLPLKKAVIKFYFAELERFQSWWIIVEGDKVDLCTDKPADESDLYVNTDVITLCKVWLGDIPWKTALNSKQVELLGNRLLANEIHQWLGHSITQALVKEMPGFQLGSNA